MHTLRALALPPLALVLCLLTGAGAGARAQQPEPDHGRIEFRKVTLTPVR